MISRHSAPAAVPTRSMADHPMRDLGAAAAGRRFLFVVPPLAGHINPTISVGRELAARGHEVTWSGLPGAVEDLLPPDAPFQPVGTVDETAGFAALRTAGQGLRGAAALKFLWQDVLIPLGRTMLPGLEAVVESWHPDVVVADQQALAGAAVARRCHLPWATSATTSAELVQPLIHLPRVRDWVAAELHRFQLAAGVTETEAALSDLRFSEQLVLVFTTPELVGGAAGYPPHYAFVGPSISDRPELDTFPWEWLDPDLPHVLVTMGTINAQASANLYAVAVDALADEALQTVFVAPEETAGLLPPRTSNILVRERVPQLGLLQHMNAVVTHGGHNTVTETLATGLPMVLAPIRDDQPIVADQVVRAGAGVRVRFGRVLPAELRKAVSAVLHEPSYLHAARRIQTSFRAAGGAEAAATHLERLAS